MIKDVRIELAGVDQEIDSDLQFMERLSKFTLLIFRSDCGKISLPKLIPIVILVLAETYMSGFFLVYSANGLGQTLIYNAGNMVWTCKCCSSIFFLVYWQFGTLQSLLCPHVWSNITLKTKMTRTIRGRLSKYSLYVAFGIVATYVTILCTKLALDYYFPGLTPVDLNVGDSQFTFGKKAVILSVILDLHTNLIWLFVIFFYVFILLRVYNYVQGFKEDIKQIGTTSKDTAELALELTDVYKKLGRLTNLVHTANSAFEVYVFWMVGSNVLIMVLTLVMFVHYLVYPTQLAIVGFGNTFIWTFELIALTVLPAKIHASLGQIETEVYANQRIWFPRNNDIYQIASYIIAHSKQEGLGISLYGFALINKPMILTTVSLVLSYILLIEQMSSSSASCTGNSTVTNITM